MRVKVSATTVKKTITERYRDDRPGILYDTNNNGLKTTCPLHSPERWAEDAMQQAEHSRARMHHLPGEFCDFNLVQTELRPYEFNITKDFVHSSMVDESYQLIGSH